MRKHFSRVSYDTVAWWMAILARRPGADSATARYFDSPAGLGCLLQPPPPRSMRRHRFRATVLLVPRLRTNASCFKVSRVGKHYVSAEVGRGAYGPLCLRTPPRQRAPPCRQAGFHHVFYGYRVRKLVPRQSASPSLRTSHCILLVGRDKGHNERIRRYICAIPGSV